jgi:hypothetical protein
MSPSPKNPSANEAPALLTREMLSQASKEMGSIDASGVRELVEEVLEGGRCAFELRRKKYGF